MISFGNNSLNIPKLAQQENVNKPQQTLATQPQVEEKQTEIKEKNDSVELSSKEKTNAEKKEAPVGVEIKTEKEKIENNTTLEKTKSIISKLMPEKDEKISSKSLLTMSTVASAVTLIALPMTKKVLGSLAMVTAFFTPYLLTKAVDTAKDKESIKTQE